MNLVALTFFTVGGLRFERRDINPSASWHRVQSRHTWYVPDPNILLPWMELSPFDERQLQVSTLRHIAPTLFALG